MEKCLKFFLKKNWNTSLFIMKHDDVFNSFKDSNILLAWYVFHIREIYCTKSINIVEDEKGVTPST